MSQSTVSQTLASIAAQMQQVALNIETDPTMQDYDVICCVGALKARIELLEKYILKHSKPGQK